MTRTTAPSARTGVRVSPLTLGAMMFGAWGNPDHDESIRIIHRALDAGINVIDTADVYARGESEEIVGKALKGRRDDVVLATKFHGAMSDEDPNHGGNSRRWIVRAVEDSLRRLQTDHIDLYQVHRPRPEIDIDETLGALSDLVHARQDPLHRHVDLPAVADRRGAVGGRAPAPRAPGDRAAAVLASWPARWSATCCRPRRSTASASCPGARSPAAGCRVATAGTRRPGGRSARAARQPARHDPTSPENRAKLEAVHALPDLADQAGVSLIHLALAFVLKHPAVSSAIIGPRTLEQLESQLGAEKIDLPDDVLDRIDEIVPPGTTHQRGRPGLRTSGPHRGRARRR